MKPIVIFGAGGFGRETLEILKDQNKIEKRWKILGFIDENKELHGKKINEHLVLGGFEWLRNNKSTELACVCSIGECETRKRIVEDINEIGILFHNAIHPSVVIKDFVELGKGIVIQAGAILAVNSKIGNHVHINFNSTIGHDAVIHDYCTISPQVAINGFNVLEEGVYVGTGASFIQDIKVGRWSTIGAGASVIRDIPERVTAVGVPAKAIKRP